MSTNKSDVSSGMTLKDTLASLFNTIGISKQAKLTMAMAPIAARVLDVEKVAYKVVAEFVDMCNDRLNKFTKTDYENMVQQAKSFIKKTLSTYNPTLGTIQFPNATSPITESDANEIAQTVKNLVELVLENLDKSEKRLVMNIIIDLLPSETKQSIINRLDTNGNVSKAKKALLALLLDNPSKLTDDLVNLVKRELSPHSLNYKLRTLDKTISTQALDTFFDTLRKHISVNDAMLLVTLGIRCAKGLSMATINGNAKGYLGSEETNYFIHFISSMLSGFEAALAESSLLKPNAAAGHNTKPTIA